MPIQGPDITATAIEDKTLDKESVIELLGEDDGKEQETIELGEPPKKDKSKETKDGKEISKEGEEEEELSLEDELEQELGEVDEDKLELTELPSRKEILIAYPDLFKKFPGLEKSIYREKAYSELLPTIQDAKVAIGKAELLDKYDKEVMSGSTESLLAAVKSNNKEAFAKVVDNYMPTLLKVDESAYYHVIGNLIKHTVINMVRDGKEQDSEELQTAAAVLNNYVFGTTKFQPPTNLSKDEIKDERSVEKETEISRRERELVERQYNSARTDLGDRIDNILKTSVDKAIDPNESMTGYVKEIATDKVLKGLEDLILRDTRFRTIYDKLWERAFDNDFSKESMDRIKSAYLSKAKTLLPLLIKKERNEALKGTNRKVDNNDKDKKGPLPVGKTRSSTTLASGKPNSKSDSKTIPRGMTSLEYLNSDD